MKSTSGDGWKLAAVALLAAGLLAACGGGPGTPQPVSEPAAAEPPTPAATATATLVLPTEEPSAVEPAPPEPTRDPGDFEMTGYELIAASVGRASYSGHLCVISPAGCACELPLLQQAAFEFTTSNKLLYHFEGNGYAATWEMTRLGPNQWNYTIPIFDENGAVLGATFVLMTFTEDGYLYTQGADFSEYGIVTCPDVNFRRVMSPEDTP